MGNKGSEYTVPGKKMRGGRQSRYDTGGGRDP